MVNNAAHVFGVQIKLQEMACDDWRLVGRISHEVAPSTQATAIYR